MFSNKMPVYIQIVNKIMSDIDSGKYTKGSRIPSIRELSSELIVNQNTVSHAYKELENMGIISNKRGIGFFITEDENILNRIHNDKIKETVKNFLIKMYDSGYTKEEIIELIKEEKC